MENTIIELLADSKKIEIGTITIDGGDSRVKVTEILSVQNKNGHTFVGCRVEFLD